MHQHPSFNKRIKEFAFLLDKLGEARLKISPYSQRYLDYLLRHRFYFLHIYASVLENAASKSNKSFSEIVLIDYGAGNGLLGMFAKFCGCKKVFLVDTAENFIEASKRSSEILGIKIDGFVTGDIGSFKKDFAHEQVDCVVGTDVIEHIYNLDRFFETICQINPEMISVFTTASNPANYLKAKKLKAMQRKDELEGGQPTDFELAGEEAHPPYFQMRKDIIADYDHELREPELTKMAALTRGKIKEDILEAVNKLKINHQWPVPPDDHNTCHPITGSWSERLLSLNDYRQLYGRHHFNLEITNGFYNEYSPGSKKTINLFMNLLVKIMGKKITPFISLIGFPQRRFTDIC